MINGKNYTVEAEAKMPLLWAIRDLVGLTGTKYGCGIAQCGACTVHLNGNPVRSCSLPVSAVASQAITTIEGISTETPIPSKKHGSPNKSLNADTVRAARSWLQQHC